MPGRIIRTGKGASGTTYRLRFHKGTRGGMGLYVGRGDGSMCVGEVFHAENFEYAVDEADEETRCLMAEARAEFGF